MTSFERIERDEQLEQLAADASQRGPQLGGEHERGEGDDDVDERGADDELGDEDDAGDHGDEAEQEDDERGRRSARERGQRRDDGR